MKKITFFVLTLTSLIIASCTEQIDTSSRYVFKDEIISGYLEKHEQYSEYVELLKMVPVSSLPDVSSVYQLLSARGNYTVFAPTNDAIQLYLDSLARMGLISEGSWDAFEDSTKLDSIRQVIVYNSIIDGGDANGYFETNRFPEATTGDAAEIDVPNMNDRKLVVIRTEDPDSILINDCMIDRINHDILTINGVIHSMHDVVAPSGNSLASLLKKMVDSNRGGYVVMSKLIEACGLLAPLDSVKDELYEHLYITKKIPVEKYAPEEGGRTFHTPEHRYYGFTIFAETDEFWSQTLGKPVEEISVADIYEYLDNEGIYPSAKRDNNYESEDNLLNQFVTYHMLPMRLPSDRLVNHYNERGFTFNTRNPTIAIYEFYTTMGKRRLLKTFESKESNGVYLNRFPNLNNGRTGDYHENSCDPQNVGIKVGEPNLQGEYNVRNGIIYPIDELLYYSDNTRAQMMRSRIRWDVTAMWPEFMNNNIRMNTLSANTGDDKYFNVYIPTDEALGFQYLNDVIIGKDTEFYYWTGRNANWANMQGDEMTIRGLYEVTMRLPPVPVRGTYELRFGQQCGGTMRGMAQFYWGSDLDRLAAMGIPIDLRQGATGINGKKFVKNDIGWVEDGKDLDYNADVDKRMRNNDFMKGCQQYVAGNPGNSQTMRENQTCLRRIMLRQTMDPDVTYYIKFKTVMDDRSRYFYMDYLEYCAKEVYDNPAEQEDIW
ncbi:MAG: fasciclin domain-containing protein [Bacteroidaceae bacterium]|nr:fasciclin domain-containing protein [Bacteroidaceae bacterium]